MQHHEEAEDEEAWIYDGQEEVPPTVRRVKIAENITEIPVEAFQRRQQLEEVIISSSVHVIGKRAFFRCHQLKSILYQGQEKEEIGIPSNVKVIDDWAFHGCRLLEELILNEGLERIGHHAFAQWRSLTEVNFPSTVKVIDDHAFEECILLARLSLNEGLQRIGNGAFNGCQSLTDVDFPSTFKVIGSSAFQACKLLARLVSNEGLERIGENAFFECESLTEVNIPSTVDRIGDFAFSGCKLLEELVLNEGLERIGKGAFYRCESLTGVEIPSTVNVIDVRAFFGCKLLGRIGLNEGLEEIEVYAFEECDSLSHVRIPQSVNSIATNAFTYCSRLISIELPEECSFDIDLSGCQSLVNLAGPMLTFRWDVHREQLFRRSKLGSLVDNKASLFHRLKHRFDNSPLNKLCYYQSYQSLDGAMVQLRSRMDENPLAATNQTDEFGMTPLHILSLSQTPNLNVLLEVMNAGRKGHMARCRDSFGCTPVDYLCLNRMPNSNEVVRRLFEESYDQVLGLDQFWKSAVLQTIDETLAADWSSRQSEIGRMVRKFERKEIISLLELCLWKMKIDEAIPKKVKIGEATSKKEQILADRQRCRVMSGAAVVVPHVLPFLDN
eukprot:scaffold1189_cov81-Cylindrotheca_fusiformis.AAC.3